MKATISGNPGKSLMKIIVDADTDRVLGMHMVGADGPEIMQVCRQGKRSCSIWQW